MKREMLEREPVVSAAIQKHVKVNFVEHYTVLFSLVVTRFTIRHLFGLIILHIILLEVQRVKRYNEESRMKSRGATKRCYMCYCIYCEGETFWFFFG